MVPVKTMILLRVRRNFGGVIVRRDALDLEFLSALRCSTRASTSRTRQEGRPSLFGLPFLPKPPG